MTRKFCEELVGSKCSILQAPCWRLDEEEKCEFIDYHNLLMTSNSKNPISSRLKKKIHPRINKGWKDFALSPKRGRKDMTGGPLERGVRDAVREILQPLQVTVPNRGKRIEVWEGVNITADVKIEKKGYPTSILEVKSWIGPQHVRDTFGYAYLLKTWSGHRNSKVFMVTLSEFSETIEGLMKACSPYLDGAYSLSDEPYFDDLIGELRNIYG
ncbi:MAG: hypothetical protein KAW09_00220 [Thermoplasmata archaeon]|nr:hypothetical protein [Thermoplasmata archaeon]